MKGSMLKAMPWLLIILGFMNLNKFQGFVSITFMVIGIVMLIERIWPEKWGEERS